MANSSSKQVLWFSADHYRSLTDDNLFKDHAINCRCCFREIQDPITEENIVKDFHRKSFEKWTNVAMSRNPNASMHICANCDLLLKEIEFKEIAAETQARYSEFLDRVDEEIQQQSDTEIIDWGSDSDSDDQEIEPDKSHYGSLTNPGNDETEVVDLTADSDIDEQEIEPGTSGIEEQQLADESENEETSTSSSAADQFPVVPLKFRHISKFFDHQVGDELNWRVYKLKISLIEISSTIAMSLWQYWLDDILKKEEVMHHDMRENRDEIIANFAELGKLEATTMPSCGSGINNQKVGEEQLAAAKKYGFVNPRNADNRDKTNKYRCPKPESPYFYKNRFVDVTKHYRDVHLGVYRMEHAAVIRERNETSVSLREMIENTAAPEDDDECVLLD